MKKIFKIVFICLVTASLLSAAEYGALSERSTGRVLSVRMRDGYHFFIFVRPMPMDTWLCREYLSGKEVEVYPTRLELMPFFDQGDDFAVELLTTWYLLHPRSTENACYAAFACLVNFSKVSRTRQFLEVVRRQGREIAELNKQYQQAASRSQVSRSASREKVSSGSNSCRIQVDYDAAENDDAQKQSIIGAITDLINEGDPFREIDAVYQNRDYFLAVAFLEYYRNCVDQWLALSNSSRRDDFMDVRQKFESIEKALVTNYRREREALFPLEDAFARVCPRQRGLWKQGAPVSFLELVNRNCAAFRSWQQSRDLSPDCDFPEWGNHMLDILSMIPGSNESDPVVVQFKSALKNYQDVFADGVN